MNWFIKYFNKNLNLVINDCVSKYKKYNITHNQLNSIVNTDNSPNKVLSHKYLLWISAVLANQNRTSNIELRFMNDGEFEDYDKLWSFLNKYYLLSINNKLNQEHKNIFSFKSLSSLITAISDYPEHTSRKYKPVTEDMGEPKIGDNNIIINEDSYKVVELTDYNKAKNLLCHSQNIKWCVKHENTWNEYDISENNPIYMILKNNKPYVLFGSEAGQLKNINDDKLNQNQIEELLPIFIKMVKLGIKIRYDRDTMDLYSNKEFVSIPEVKKMLVNNPVSSYQYAYYTLKGRFPEGEPAISKNVGLSFLYAKDILKGRFELAEPIIGTSARFSYHYAYYVLKDRFEMGEPAINSDPYYSKLYAKNIFKYTNKNQATNKSLIPLS